MTSGFIASRLVSAAPISDPMSRRPVVSTVTWTIRGTVMPVLAIARRAATRAALPWSRSWTVSTSRTSTPPSSSPSIWGTYASRSSENAM